MTNQTQKSSQSKIADQLTNRSSEPAGQTTNPPSVPSEPSKPSQPSSDLSSEALAKEAAQAVEETSQPSQPSQPAKDIKGTHWYVVHTYSGHEAKVAATLKQRIQSQKLEGKILDILVP